MSSLANCGVLACATLSLAACVEPAVSAAEECSQSYKICNWSCERFVRADENFPVCKAQCDYRLIACDRRSANSSTRRG